jgi:signal transduction histidine kinase
MLYATTSHELRNPLNGIISMLQVLEDNVEDNMREYVQIASSSSRLMLALVN